MQTFIYDNTTCCLCNINNNQIWNYACEACLDAAIAAGCLKEGQIVSIPSSNDGTPIEGDACRLWLNNASNGMIPVVNGTTSAFNTMKATDMTYTSATCTLNVTNMTATGCINGIPYNCYAQICDVSTAESCACCYTIEKCKEYGIEIPEKEIQSYQRYINMEHDRGVRRGGKLPSIEKLQLK